MGAGDDLRQPFVDSAPAASAPPAAPGFPAAWQAPPSGASFLGPAPAMAPPQPVGAPVAGHPAPGYPWPPHPPPPPGMGPPAPGPIIIAADAPPPGVIITRLSNTPRLQCCPACGVTGPTRVRRENGCCTYMACFGLCWLFCPLFWLPFCLDCDKDLVHRCGKCKAEIARVQPCG